ncbi:MAG: hypothetical protein WC526_01980 [Patescibacteria group bacterium]
MIIGHKKILDYFDNALANKNLAQSYCFVGYDEVGKRTVARNICAKLLRVDEAKLDLYPDFYYVAREEDEKTGKLKKDISIAQARQIKDRVGRKSWLGEYQSVIIDEAELLNEESGSALLKILEETKGQCVFFLLTTDDNALLPTIRSRCQMFYFPLIEKGEIEAGLKEMGFEQTAARDSANLSWGRPGKAINLAQDAVLRKSYGQEIERWNTIMSVPFYKRMSAVSDLFGDKTDTIRSRDKVLSALEIWIILWREVMLKNLFLPNNNLSAKDAARLIDEFKKARVLLNQNINPKLIIEQILLTFS